MKMKVIRLRSRSTSYQVNENNIKYSINGHHIEIFSDDEKIPQKVARAGLEINIVGKRVKKERKIGLDNASWEREFQTFQLEPRHRPSDKVPLLWCLLQRMCEICVGADFKEK